MFVFPHMMPQASSQRSIWRIICYTHPLDKQSAHTLIQADAQVTTFHIATAQHFKAD